MINRCLIYLHSISLVRASLACHTQPKRWSTAAYSTCMPSLWCPDRRGPDTSEPNTQRTLQTYWGSRVFLCALQLKRRSTAALSTYTPSLWRPPGRVLRARLHQVCCVTEQLLVEGRVEMGVERLPVADGLGKDLPQQLEELRRVANTPRTLQVRLHKLTQQNPGWWHVDLGCPAGREVGGRTIRWSSFTAEFSLICSAVYTRRSKGAAVLPCCEEEVEERRRRRRRRRRRGGRVPGRCSRYPWKS